MHESTRQFEAHRIAIQKREHELRQGAPRAAEELAQLRARLARLQGLNR